MKSATLEAALWAFNTTHNFRDALVAAVNLGGDADTIGAVCESPEGEDPDYHLYADRMKKKDWEWLIKFDCHHPMQKNFFEAMAKRV